MKARVSLLAAAFCCAVLLSGPPAMAAKPKGKNPGNLKNPTAEAIFKYLDKDKDTFLTVKELKDAKTGAEAKEAEARFKKWDTDSDGKLSLDEYNAGYPSTIPAKKQKPGKKK